MHVPVLKQEVLKYLNPQRDENFIDCTVGEGGHTVAILQRNSPNGKILGVEIDSELYQKLKSRIPNRLLLVNDSFVNLKKIVEKYKFKAVNGILFDLGMSSWHLEESEKGFSFMKDEPLIMRYDSKTQNFLTAGEVVNFWPEREIEKILKEYGNERFAKRIAKKICEERRIKPIRTTLQLVEIVRTAFPTRYRFSKKHFATRTFQALRIAVNNELENLSAALPQALEVLKPGGRLVIISFHSGEDKIVKNFFREQVKMGSLEVLTKKPILPGSEEIKTNPRSRSAKLRAAVKS